MDLEVRRLGPVHIAGDFQRALLGRRWLAFPEIGACTPR
jgi:hypothetical protein